jgi:hypothetical protein
MINVLACVAGLALLVAAAQILSRSLPAQNIALIVGSLVAAEFVFSTIGFGSGALWRNLLFWPAVILWTRIVTRWFLRRWRKDWNYGIWLIILASAGVALAQLALTFFALGWSTAIKQSSARFAEAGLCLFCLSPWFISKLPQEPHKHA